MTSDPSCGQWTAIRRRGGGMRISRMIKRIVFFLAGAAMLGGLLLPHPPARTHRAHLFLLLGGAFLVAMSILPPPVRRATPRKHSPR
jgi:hypothetical protein